MRKVATLVPLVALLGVGALMLGGCGQTSAGQPNLSGSPAAGAGGQTTSGQVSLLLDRQQYGASDGIIATVVNGLATTIWVADHQTNCSILTVEIQQGTQWVPVGRCRSMIATRMMPIAGGSQTPVQLLNAGSAPQNTWPAGTYRAKLTYMSSETSATGPSGVVYSSLFTIS